MEAEKPKNLQTVRWRDPEKLTCSSHPKASRFKTQKEPMLRSNTKDQERPTSQLNSQAFLLGLFILVRSLVDWMKPTHTGESNLLYSVYDSN